MTERWTTPRSKARDVRRYLRSGRILRRWHTVGRHVVFSGGRDADRKQDGRCRRTLAVWRERVTGPTSSGGDGPRWLLRQATFARRQCSLHASRRRAHQLHAVRRHDLHVAGARWRGAGAGALLPSAGGVSRRQPARQPDAIRRVTPAPRRRRNQRPAAGQEAAVGLRRLLLLRRHGRLNYRWV